MAEKHLNVEFSDSEYDPSSEIDILLNSLDVPKRLRPDLQQIIEFSRVRVVGGATTTPELRLNPLSAKALLWSIGALIGAVRVYTENEFKKKSNDGV